MSTDWNKTTKHIVAVGMVLFGLYLLYLSAPVLKIVIIGALTAFLLMPVVTFLHNRLKMPRLLAILLSYLVLIVVILLSPLILLPPVIDGYNVIAGLDYQALAGNLLRWTEERLVSVSQVETSLLGFSGVATSALEALRNTSLTELMALPSVENVFTSVRSTLSFTLNAATSLAGSVTAGVLAVILTLLYSIYFSLDADKLGPGPARRPEPGRCSRAVGTYSKFWPFHRGCPGRHRGPAARLNLLGGQQFYFCLNRLVPKAIRPAFPPPTP